MGQDQAEAATRHAETPLWDLLCLMDTFRLRAQKAPVSDFRGEGVISALPLIAVSIRRPPRVIVRSVSAVRGMWG